MPSCPCNISYLRKDELNTALTKSNSHSTSVLHHVIATKPYICLLCLFSPKDICWCFYKNFFVSINYWEKSIYKSITSVIKCVKLGKNIVGSVEIRNLQFQSISNWTKVAISIKYYNCYVISTLIIYLVLLKITPSFLFIKKLISLVLSLLQLNPMSKIDSYSNGITIDSVMDVGEPVNKVKACTNILSNGDNCSEDIKQIVALSETDGTDGVHSTVINDDKVTNGSDHSQCINSTIPSASVKIKEEVISEYNEEQTEDPQKNSLPNGGVESNCQSIIKEAKYAKSVTCEQVQNTLDESNKTVNSVANGSKEDIHTNGVKEELTGNLTGLIKTYEVKIECKVKSEAKSLESSSEKDKVKDKDQYTNNSSNHISSSSPSSSTSSKKYSSHSHSSSSHHRYRDDTYKSCSSSSRSRDKDRSKSSDSRSKSRSCHHKAEEKCHCKSRHHSHHHSVSSSSSKKSKKVQNNKTQCTGDEIAFELSGNKIDPTNPYFTRVPWVPHPQIAGMKYARYYRIEEDRNGGATVCHLYMDEICHLPEAQLNECAIEFIKLSYSEDENECAYHVMGIVHGAATYLPDLVDYMADHYPTLIVKTGSLASRDNHTTTMSQYRDEVYKTYSNGTFRYAPLDQLSICGVLGEEVGAYFPDFVARLEQSPFMKPVMPWSFMSVVQTDNPRESNDGPIFWVRPGEQMLPANEALKESTRPKKRRNNELNNLAYIGGSRFSEARESLFMDRTKAHADQVGVDYGITNTAPTAAVGVLKAVNCGHPEHGNRATKDVVAFHAQDYIELLEILMLDLYEPPQTQCTKWIEVSKLNTLRREGIRYAHLQLHDNDVYYLPRKIIHQFQTISSVASVAWHIRYRDYFKLHGAPNLHTPTGINKGQVFYEKKNVAVYCPPIHENDLLAAVTGLDGELKTPKKSERLREYSPFKHSPRKLHKFQSPRSASKKEKSAESVQSQSDGNPKNEPESRSNDHEKNSSGTAGKRHERSKSLETKQEQDKSRKASDKTSSESNHFRRTSGEHTPSKSEKISTNNHSNHRKEVKNLEADFNIKNEKSKVEKSPKSKHPKTEEASKHGKSSKESRHDGKSSKSNSGSGSSHNSTSSKLKRNKEHESSTSHKVKTEERSDDVSRKRKHGDSPHRSSSKKPKDETRDSEVLAKDGNCLPEMQVSGISDSNTSNIKIKLDPVECEPHCPALEEPKRAIAEDVSPKGNDSKLSGTAESSHTISAQVGSPIESNNCNFDLKHNLSFVGFTDQVPPLPPPPPPSPPPPPPPSNSPPSNPPLPSPHSESSPEGPPQHSHVYSAVPSTKTSHPASLEKNCHVAKDRADSHAKKVKKKLAKNDSFDLLGDIMSKMDRKNL